MIFIGMLIGGLFLVGLGFALGYAFCHHQMTDMLIDSCRQHIEDMNKSLKLADEELKHPVVEVDRSVDLDPVASK